MLRSLHIQNYVLIERLDIDFENGFSVITGETGAGKSILLGAIGLLLGRRADLKMLKAGAQRCIIEAHFDLSQYHLGEYFEAHDLDFDGTECIIRRELTANGKTRAFINDTPTSLAELKELGEQLIDVHSQHQNLLLNKEDFQLRVVDAVAQDEEQLTQYRKLYKDYQQARDEYERMQEQAAKDQSEQDYLTYQWRQLEEARLSEEEETELEQELSTLEHAEDIKATLYESGSILEAESNGVIDMLRETKRKMEAIAHVYPSADELTERLDSCYIEVRDIAQEISNNMEQVDYDPERLAYVNERIATLHTLKQKFHAEDIAALIRTRESLAQRLSLIENSDEALHRLSQHIAQLQEQLTTVATTLTQLRTKAAHKIEKEMTQRLVPLGMPNVQFKANISPTNAFTATGHDHITFLFSANAGIPMQPISQVASGGEISRLMLALKTMTSNIMKLPTIIFDEIDTGVSGHIAERMAEMMREMGDDAHRQVITITHLPQIAARGSHHYRVFKTDDALATTTHIVRLSPVERIEEVARMLSGSTLTQAAIENARALLG